MMQRQVDDRWLWLGFGVVLFFAARGVRYAITDIVNITKIDSSQLDSKQATENAEDSESCLKNSKI